MIPPALIRCSSVLVLLAAAGNRQDGPASRPRPEPTSRPASVDELVAALAEVRARQGTKRAFCAPVVQSVHTPQLAKPMRSQGTLWFQAPDRFRLELVTPRRSCIVLNGGTFASFRGTDQAPVASGSGGSLSREITELLALADAPETLRAIARQRHVVGTISADEVEVTLRPLRAGEKILERYAEVMLRVRRSDGQPAALLLSAGGGDRTEFALAAAERSAALPDELFRTDRFTPAAK
jgi:hypothetical protein